MANALYDCIVLLCAFLVVPLTNWVIVALTLRLAALSATFFFDHLFNFFSYRPNTGPFGISLKLGFVFDLENRICIYRITIIISEEN